MLIERPEGIQEIIEQIENSFIVNVLIILDIFIVLRLSDPDDFLFELHEYVVGQDFGVRQFPLHHQSLLEISHYLKF